MPRRSRRRREAGQTDAVVAELEPWSTTCSTSFPSSSACLPRRWSRTKKRSQMLERVFGRQGVAAAARFLESGCPARPAGPDRARRRRVAASCTTNCAAGCACKVSHRHAARRQPQAQARSRSLRTHARRRAQLRAERRSDADRRRGAARRRHGLRRLGGPRNSIRFASR